MANEMSKTPTDSGIPPEVQIMTTKIAAYAVRLGMTMRPSKEGITLVDDKGLKAAHIDLAGTVTREFRGRQCLLGMVAVVEIKRLLAGE